MKSDLNFLEKDLSYKIYGIFLKIGKEFGTGFKEEIYVKACENELNIQKVKFVSKPKIDIFSSRGDKVGILIPDMIIEDKILVEFKAQKSLLERSISQLIKYLEKSEYEIGYLVNFGLSYTQIIRRVYSNKLK